MSERKCDRKMGQNVRLELSPKHWIPASAEQPELGSWQSGCVLRLVSGTPEVKGRLGVQGLVFIAQAVETWETSSGKLPKR